MIMEASFNLKPRHISMKKWKNYNTMTLIKLKKMLFNRNTLMINIKMSKRYFFKKKKN